MISLDKFRRVWTFLTRFDAFGRVWMRFNKVWRSLEKFGGVWRSLEEFGGVWTLKAEKRLGKFTWN